MTKLEELKAEMIRTRKIAADATLAAARAEVDADNAATAADDATYDAHTAADAYYEAWR